MALQPITIQLSDETLQRAQGTGLLAPDRVEDVFLRELERQKKVARFFEMADQLQQLNQTAPKRIEPPRRGGLLELANKLSALNESDPITPEDIETEISAVRAAKRAGRTKALTT
jgi:hypothetical protein